MTNILLHIGRHKSGTTSLQNAFVSNRDELARIGITYPEKGIRNVAHHPIAEAVHQYASQGSDFMADDSIRSFRELIDKANTPWVLVSSEGFQRCRPSDVARLFDGHRVTVIVYLRDQISYLQSAYLQEVHASDYHENIEQFEDKVFYADYLNFYESWVETFGESNVIVRIFNKDFMRNGDVVTDFFEDVLTQVFGHPVAYIRPVDTAMSRNASLSGIWIQFKLRLNAVLRSKGCREFPLYNALGRRSALVKEKINLVSEDLASRVISKYHHNNVRLLDRLSYPSSALDGAISDIPTPSVQLGPLDFFRCMTELITEEPRCSFLIDECYSVEITSTDYYHAMTFCNNILLDHIDLLYVQRNGNRVPFSSVIGTAGQLYVAPTELFSPGVDMLVAELGPGCDVKLIQRHLDSPRPV